MTEAIITLLYLAGMWNLTDGIFSIWTYWGRDDETWAKNHCVRIVRLLIGIALIYAGWLLLCTIQ